MPGNCQTSVMGLQLLVVPPLLGIICILLLAILQARQSSLVQLETELRQ